MGKQLKKLVKRKKKLLEGCRWKKKLWKEVREAETQTVEESAKIGRKKVEKSGEEQ